MEPQCHLTPSSPQGFRILPNGTWLSSCIHKRFSVLPSLNLDTQALGGLWNWSFSSHKVNDITEGYRGSNDTTPYSAISYIIPPLLPSSTS